MTEAVLVIQQPAPAHTLTITDGDSTQILTIDSALPQVLEVGYSKPGPPGPQGPPGVGNAIVHTQLAPIASIAIAHPFGRLPVVSIYLNGEEVEADVSTDNSYAYVAFATPTAFVAVLI